MRYILGCSKSDSRHKQLFDKGSAQIERMLDIQSIIKHYRSLLTLQRLFLSKAERKLIGMQRRTRVIELSWTDSSSDNSIGAEAQKEIELDRAGGNEIAGSEPGPANFLKDSFRNRLQKGIMKRNALEEVYKSSESPRLEVREARTVKNNRPLDATDQSIMQENVSNEMMPT